MFTGTVTLTQGSGPATDTEVRPWPALGALCVGFFMILVDMTIVSVATPAILETYAPHGASVNDVIWVTSAYLLAYAVPILITGRLGDRIGPKRMYLGGLVVFTLASLWCGLAFELSHSIWMLVVARVLQGFGAAALAPQTMAVITRIFPRESRGSAMSLWGATAGVATLVGPILGGVLVDVAGWEWIFFINIPVGIVGFVLAWILVPKLETHPHKFDLVGVFLSAIGLFLIVFGLQEGETYDWGVIWGPITVWGLIITGVVVMGLFIWQQARTKSEALVPLELFRDRNFSVANIGIATVGFTVTSMSLPLMFFLQLARGLTPTESAVLLIPMAVAAGVLSPLAGRWLDRTDPRVLLVPGLLLVAGSLVLYSVLMNLDTPIWVFLIPSFVMGVGNAGMWGPLATTATRNLAPRQAGAGAGIYNTTRTIGSVLGSAAIAVFMQSRIEANIPGAADAPGGSFGSGALPDVVAEPFATAMAQSVLLSAAAMLVGVVAVLFLRRPKATSTEDWQAANEAVAAD